MMRWSNSGIAAKGVIYSLLLFSAFKMHGSINESNLLVPTSEFSFVFLNGLSCQGSTIQFTNNSSTLSGEIVFMIWDFGDGNSSSVVNPTHTYQVFGNLTVTLTVYNSDGDYDVSSQLIVVNPLPSINFQIDNNTTQNQCFSSTQFFDNLSSIPTDDLTYDWDFGDGTNSTDFEPNHNFQSEGFYEVQLTATSASTGCSSFTRIPLEIFPEPEVSFGFENKCLGSSIDFENYTEISTGNISFSWDFDDGTLSSLENPSKEFDASGSYDVGLQVTTESGCVTNLVQEVLVFEQPISVFSVQNVCRDTAAYFENESLFADNYSWYYGDGSGSTAIEPTHNYSKPGEYQVALVSRNSDGCLDSTTSRLTIHPIPQVSFETDSACEGSPVILQNTSQILSGTMSYHWDLGDGSYSESIEVNHTYESDSEYEVTLTASSNHGCDKSQSQYILIYDQPIAQFEAKNVCADSFVTFINKSTGDNMSFLWDFGDGVADTLENPVHQYTSAGNYPVQLIVNSPEGCQDFSEKSVSIYPLPELNFFTKDVCDTVTVRYNNFSTISSGSINFRWDFGDGTTSDSKNPNHQYSGPGKYLVQLAGQSNWGCVSTLSNTVTVHPRPNADYLVNPVCDGMESLFQNKTRLFSGELIETLWDFDDGTNSIVTNPTKQFLNPGIYEVNLQVKSDQGCESGITHSVEVYERPVADFDIKNVCDGFPVVSKNQSFVSTGDLKFQWDFDDGFTSNDVNPSHIYPGSALYSVLLTSTTSNGCEDSIRKDVLVYDHPTVDAGLDVRISQGYSTRLEAVGADSYSWQPVEELDNSNIRDPQAFPAKTTTYWVMGVDQYGCSNSDSITVTVDNDYRLIANNVFTPDGNGTNDTWVIQNVETFGTVNVRVYDRYGQLVFQDFAYENDWSGTYGNDILPDGTYYYLITFSDSDIRYKGSLTLIRNR